DYYCDSGDSSGVLF
nr:immunoglobulin light chain junction region [Macaca mulatta]MOW07256.1 immunoglobulin light chain junction region [Macaca mulatta]